MNNNEILIQVVEKAGGWRALGRGLKINYQAIQSWKRIPAERVIAIEQITGIPRKRLRPDLYGSTDNSATDLLAFSQALEKKCHELGCPCPDEEIIKWLWGQKAEFYSEGYQQGVALVKKIKKIDET